MGCSSSKQVAHDDTPNTRADQDTPRESDQDDTPTPPNRPRSSTVRSPPTFPIFESELGRIREAAAFNRVSDPFTEPRSAETSRFDMLTTLKEPPTTAQPGTTVRFVSSVTSGVQQRSPDSCADNPSGKLGSG